MKNTFCKSSNSGIISLLILLAIATSILFRLVESLSWISEEMISSSFQLGDINLWIFVGAACLCMYACACQYICVCMYEQMNDCMNESLYIHMFVRMNLHHTKNIRTIPLQIGIHLSLLPRSPNDLHLEAASNVHESSVYPYNPFSTALDIISVQLQDHSRTCILRISVDKLFWRINAPQ